jgi:antitoxin HicB
MYDYPVEITPDDNDTVLVTFVDLPGATFGEDEGEALLRAVDALETALSVYIDKRLDLPPPSPAEGRPTVAPSLLAVMKLEIYRAMRARGWRKSDLARALRIYPSQIDRLFNLQHATPVDFLEKALDACGSRFEVSQRAA